MTSATLPATGIVHHTALLPLSEGSVAIGHVLGAMNYRPVRADEVRSTQVNFRRLPIAPRNAATSSAAGLISISSVGVIPQIRDCDPYSPIGRIRAFHTGYRASMGRYYWQTVLVSCLRHRADRCNERDTAITTDVAIGIGGGPIWRARASGGLLR